MEARTDCAKPWSAVYAAFMATSFPLTQIQRMLASVLISLLLIGDMGIAVADMTVPHATFDCNRGCRKTFTPVCGEDGRTYSNPCVAACQEVQVALEGPCPGEHLLHPDNEHVVAGGGEEEEEEVVVATKGSAARRPSAGAAGGVVTRQHLDAYRHEGFRYAGQMRFTADMAGRRSHARQQPQPQPQQDADDDTGAPAESDLPSLQPGRLRAVRITREGHVYLADMDENVDRVLDTLIQRHQEETAAAAAAAAASAADAAAAELHSELEPGRVPRQHHQPYRTQTLLHNLQQWRDHGRGGGSGSGGGGSKWARHTIVTPVTSPADHALQPLLEATGAAATAAAGFAAAQGSPSVPTNTAASADTTAESAQNAHQEGESGGTRVLGGSGAGRDRQRQQEKAANGKQQEKATNGKQQEKLARGKDGGGGSSSVHRMVRRSLGIFETDDRIDCPRTATYPFTAVGQINVRDSSGNYVCSGALVGPDVVLTAGHCVFNRGAQAFYDSLDFAPARYHSLDGSVVNPFGVVPWKDVTVYQGYQSLTTPDPNVVDIAVITLKERIGSQAGWMGVFEPCSPYAPSRYVALTAGYPSDQLPGTCKTTQCVVVQDPCTDGYLYHKCDTASGQSGSPMYMMAMTASRKMGPYIRGVHNIEWVQEMPDGSTVSYINSAVSITPDHYRSILAWIGLSFTTNGTTPMGPALPPDNYTAQLYGSR